MNPPEQSFADLDTFFQLPRLAGLALSPDGSRLVTSVAVLGPKRTGYISSLWEVATDPDGPAAHRLTWGAESETGPVFRPDGSLLFVSSRPDPDDDEDERPPSLWLLPAGPGEARPFVTRPGGVSGVAVAADAPTTVIASPTFPSSTTAGEDDRRRQARQELKVGATLHDTSPFRFWDHYYGPETDRLLVVREPAARDLTGPVGPALAPDPDYALTPDGSTVICSWQRIRAGGVGHAGVVAIDVATGERRELLDEPHRDFFHPVVSPDGTKVALAAETRATVGEPEQLRLVVLHLDSGDVHDAAPDWDRRPSGRPAWTPDSASLLVVADEQGQAPVFRIDLADGTARRLTAAGSFTDLLIAKDGTAAYALRGTIGSPPAPVRIDPETGQVTGLRGPADPPTPPGTLTEVHTSVLGDQSVHSWLVLPEGAGPDKPAPLLLWVHGGPHDSWRSWHWRWNPWLAAARGYAVLLPDPALSTGYGHEFLRRGRDGWAEAPFADLMAVTDAVVDRPDIDGDKTAAMGASYGGYMVNWIAGQTGRFRGIVSHAGCWDLETFSLTTDAPYYSRPSETPESRALNSPSRHAAAITTPMLITHGERDYRVPVGEALAMFTRLGELSVTDDGTMPHRLLVFPDEGHWVAKPQNARLWYETVFAFLAQTVHGEPWQAPDLLR